MGEKRFTIKYKKPNTTDLVGKIQENIEDLGAKDHHVNRDGTIVVKKEDGIDCEGDGGDGEGDCDGGDCTPEHRYSSDNNQDEPLYPYRHHHRWSDVSPYGAIKLVKKRKEEGPAASGSSFRRLSEGGSYGRSEERDDLLPCSTTNPFKRRREESDDARHRPKDSDARVPRVRSLPRGLKFRRIKDFSFDDEDDQTSSYIVPSTGQSITVSLTESPSKPFTASLPPLPRPYFHRDTPTLNVCEDVKPHPVPRPESHPQLMSCPLVPRPKSESRPQLEPCPQYVPRPLVPRPQPLPPPRVASSGNVLNLIGKDNVVGVVKKRLEYHYMEGNVSADDMANIQKRAIRKAQQATKAVPLERIQKLVDDYVDMLHGQGNDKQ